MESEALRHKQQVELSYLANDTSESNNIADNHPALVSKAKEIFNTARTDTIDFPFGGIIQSYRS